MSEFFTAPNQKVVYIHRQDTGKNFISINKESYSKAYRDMSKSAAALGLYIWLVGNKDNYKFAFSPQAIENNLGMARSSCHDAFKKLLELGYLVQRDESNVYDFYEVTKVDTKRKKIVADIDNIDEAEVVVSEQDELEAPKKPAEPKTVDFYIELDDRPPKGYRPELAKLRDAKSRFEF